MSIGFRSFRRAVVESLIGQTLTLGLSAAFLLLSSRWLGPENRGVLSLLQSSAQFGAALLGLGFSNSVPAIVGRDHRTLRWVVATQWRLAAFELLISLVLLFVGARTAFPAIAGREILVALTVVALSMQAIAFGATLAIGNARAPNALGVLAVGLSLCILVFARATDRLTVDVVLVAQLVGAGVGALLNVELLRRHATLDTTHTSGAQLLRAAIRPSFQAYLSMIFALALFRADIFIVERLGGGLRSAGLYSVAIFAAELILKVPQWASGVLTASVAMESSQGPRRTVTLFVGSVVAAVVCMLPLLFLSRIDSLLTAILGKDYHGIALLMLALGPRIVMQAGTTILAANLAGRGFTWYHPSACGAGMVAVVVLDLVFVPTYGALGAAIGSSIGYSAAAILMLRGFLVLERMTFGEFLAMAVAVSRERLSSPFRRYNAASATSGPSLPL